MNFDSLQIDVLDPALRSSTLPLQGIKLRGFGPAPVRTGLIRGGVQQAYERMHAAMKRNLPDSSKFVGLWKDHTAIVVGGGPSLQHTLSEIRIRKKLARKTLIIAPNKSHDFLVSKGIVPDIATMMDPAPWLIDYITPRKDVLYFLGSTLDPKIFDKFAAAGARVIITHYGFDPMKGEKAYVEREFPDRVAAFVYGPSTSGLRSISLLLMLGITKIVLHGLDSCKAPGGSLYAYDKPVIKKGDLSITARNRGRKAALTAITNKDMRIQVDDFADIMKNLDKVTVNGAKPNVRILAAGDGLIPWMCFQAGEEARANGLTPRFDHTKPEAMRRKYGIEGHYDYAASKYLEGMPEPILMPTFAGMNFGELNMINPSSDIWSD